MKEHLQAIVTVLALVNPAICGAIFTGIESGRPAAARLKDATKAALAVSIVLAIAALAGARVLHQFGVSLDAFSVAGGGVLAWMGFSMLRGGSAMPVSSPPAGARGGDTSPSLTPLILFAASPGTITGVITLSVAHTRLALPATALVAIAVAVAVMWVALVLLSRLSERDEKGGAGGNGGGGFVRGLVTPFMGLIVIAMGVQFALTGLKAFLSGGS